MDCPASLAIDAPAKVGRNRIASEDFKDGDDVVGHTANRWTDVPFVRPGSIYREDASD